MKKTVSSVFLCILILAGFLMNNKPLEAEEFIATTTKPFENMYVVNTQTNHRSDLGYLFVNDELVYCIEPLKFVNDGDVVIPSGELSNELRETLSIISFMGYSSSRSSEKWYAATQIMIWEALGYSQTVYGFDDYESYRQQIQERIDNFYKLPSFSNQLFTLKKGVTQVIDDTNKVLSLFGEVIASDKDIKLERFGDQIHLTSTSNRKNKGDIAIRKFNDASLGLAIVYIGKDNKNTQSMIKTQLSKNVNGLFHYNVQPYGKLILKKRGEIIDRIEKEKTIFGDKFTIKYVEAGLSNVVIDVYAREDIVDVNNVVIYKKNQRIETLVSNDSEVVSKELIDGKYYLKERKALEAYVLDNKEYDFTIHNDTVEFDTQEKTLINKRSKIDVRIQKVMEEHPFLDLSEAYQDVQFGIYNTEDILDKDEEVLVPKESLLYSSKLKEDGSLKEKVDLPLGKYYLKELKTNKNYVLDANKYPFELEGNNKETITVEIGKDKLKNKLIRSKLKIFKVDDENKKPLQATFVLYDQKMNRIKEFETNVNGEFTIDNLVNGIYYIQEKEAPKDYRLNPTFYKVEIDGRDIELKLENKKEAKAVVNTFDSTHFQNFSLMLLLPMFIFCLTGIKRVLKK